MTDALSSIPSSVYRFQMNRSFTLQSVLDLLPYLQDLGIEGVCCSPLYDAVTPGGYDVVDPNRLHPEICSQKEFDVFTEKLAKLEMKLIFDVVPNHMGISGKKNRWWIDVLKRGEASSYAYFFDIDWSPPNPSLKGKVLLPILQGPYKVALENREIELIWEDGEFWIRYFEHRFPLCPESLVEKEGRESILERFRGNVREIEGLLERQYYRLSYWKMAGAEINYRRFFNISKLAAIRIEDEKVLEEHHRFLFELIKSGKIQGLRIDHPDGLFDPCLYFERLQKKGSFFVLTEKILDFQEMLPERWEVEGTVGYDFLNMVNGLFIQKKNEEELNAIYSSFIGYEQNFEDILYQRRKSYIEQEMGSQIRSLVRLLESIAVSMKSEFEKEDLQQAIKEIVACYPVYRTYIRPGPKERIKDCAYIELAIENARKKAFKIHPALFDFLQTLLLMEVDPNDEEAILFAMRFQQITAPARAKGLEDSAFYIYNRLISLNEVGGYPRTFGTTIENFHAFNRQKLALWPLGSLASSTHDTKFSEDARMRINVLSEIPKLWRSKVHEWQKQNRNYKTRIDEAEFPDANAEYFLYQLMVALWPVSEERLWGCFLKSIREAGLYTSWIRPSQEYETAAETFVRSLFSLSASGNNGFLASFASFHEEIARAGSLNSLSSIVMKMGSCGIADLYQGDEWWNFHHVDPDNRSDVDYALRKKLLKNSEEKKLRILSQSLALRKSRKELFLKGEYLPLTINHDEAIGWIRQLGSDFAIVLAGRFFYGRKEWKGEVVLPENFTRQELVNLFTKETIPLHQKEGKSILFLSDILGEFPGAILISKS